MSQKKPVLRTEPCPKCREEGEDDSGDNLAIYGENDFYCYRCGHTQGGVSGTKEYLPTLIKGDVAELKERGITETTCQKYNVRTTTFTGTLSRQELKSEHIVIYPIYENGSLIKQKLRGRHNKKLQAQVGHTECKELFGKNCFYPSEKISITITEGENDAMCIHQATGWPAVSIVTGAGNAAKEIEANLEWLMQWRHVNLCFDMDDAGRKAAKECAALLPPTKGRIVNMPLKDANEMVQAGRGLEIKKCLYDATIVKPPTLLYVEDVIDKALIQPKVGEPWPWQSMTDITYGRRDGDIILLAAATACGKTLFAQHLASQIIDQGGYVGIFSLEQSADSTLQRFTGDRLNKTLHIPESCVWEDVSFREEMMKIKSNVCFYNQKNGIVALEGLLINIRFIALAHKAKLIVVDNLKKLATNPIIDGRRVNQIDYMRHCVAKLDALADEVGVTIIIITHLNADKIQLSYEVKADKFTDVNEMINTAPVSWETGRMPTMTSIYGATMVTDLVDYIIVLARDRHNEDPEIQNSTKVKFLKTRLDGTKDGKGFTLHYDTQTGGLSEKIKRKKTTKKTERLEYTPLK